MKRACIISCFGYYELRAKYVENYLAENGYDSKLIFSNFDHIKKEKVKPFKKNVININVREYRSNISLDRIFSHIDFAKNVERYLNSQKPFDLVYCILPPNFLGGVIKKYKKQHQNVRVFFDVYDIWPESFPLPGSKFIKPWANMRNDNLNIADGVFLECEHYKTVLKKYLPMERTHVMYLAKDDSVELHHVFDDSKIHFLYLGSINNIFDLKGTLEILTKVNQKRKVDIHIIGDGKKRTEFLSELKRHHIEFVYHGMVFDQDKKEKIFKKCDFGLNVYKRSCEIGLTMKSLDYFQYGIPVISKNIYDTGEIIELKGTGFNVKDGELNSCVRDIVTMTKDKWDACHAATIEVFQEMFSKDAVARILRNVL